MAQTKVQMGGGEDKREREARAMQLALALWMEHPGLMEELSTYILSSGGAEEMRRIAKEYRAEAQGVRS